MIEHTCILTNRVLMSLTLLLGLLLAWGVGVQFIIDFWWASFFVLPIQFGISLLIVFTIKEILKGNSRGEVLSRMLDQEKIPQKDLRRDSECQ